MRSVWNLCAVLAVLMACALRAATGLEALAWWPELAFTATGAAAATLALLMAVDVLLLRRAHRADGDKALALRHKVGRIAPLVWLGGVLVSVLALDALASRFLARSQTVEVDAVRTRCVRVVSESGRGTVARDSVEGHWCFAIQDRTALDLPEVRLPAELVKRPVPVGGQAHLTVWRHDSFVLGRGAYMRVTQAR